MNEQLQQGHIKTSTSEWNTPIFTIKKKSGKWRLLHDLRAVNATMKPMGALQPGMPSPAAIPKEWPLLIVDLKDWFFSIPLHPDDTKRFTFSVPQKNHAGPAKRYEWVVLPQEMRNSPTMCQWYVDLALQDWKKYHSGYLVYHYMDDILIAGKTDLSQESENHLLRCLEKFGLHVAPEKIQRTTPWMYLGLTVTESWVRPSKLSLQKQVQNVTNVQKLVGDIQWVRTWCGITNEDMEPLFELLKGSTSPSDKRKLNAQAVEKLKIIEQKITCQQAYKFEKNYPIEVLVYGKLPYLSALIAQITNKNLAILEWVFPPYSQSATVTTLPDFIAALILKARQRVRQVFGQDPEMLYIPWEKEELIQEWCLQSVPFTLATHGIPLSVHYPSHPLFKTTTSIIERPPIVQQKPIINAITVFTDTSGKTGKYGFVWKSEGQWHEQIYSTNKGSVQTLELRAVLLALSTFLTTPINLVVDSAYVVGLVNRIDHAILGKMTNPMITDLTYQLYGLILERRDPLWCVHVKSHTNLPGLFAEGNAHIDNLVSAPVTVNSFDQARSSHELFHQSSRGLALEFNIPRSQARTIVAACPDCARVQPIQHLGVNPRGLLPCQIWQTDVTEYAPFGRCKYVHVTVDTYSHAVWATAMTTTAFRAVKTHLLQAFAILGVPQQIKTDNAPAYKGHWATAFFALWGIEHVTGVPYNSTRQGIVERRHQDLKRLFPLLKKEGELTLSPQDIVTKACYVLNWKNPIEVNHNDHFPIDLQFVQRQKEKASWKAPVYLWDPRTQQWSTEPAELLTWGRGYACVSTDQKNKPQWVPAKWVKPAVKQNSGKTDLEDTSTDK